MGAMIKRGIAGIVAPDASKLTIEISVFLFPQLRRGELFLLHGAPGISGISSLGQFLPRRDRDRMATAVPKEI
jgi:hypothetical protein